MHAHVIYVSAFELTCLLERVARDFFRIPAAVLAWKLSLHREVLGTASLHLLP